MLTPATSTLSYTTAHALRVVIGNEHPLFFLTSAADIYVALRNKHTANSQNGMVPFDHEAHDDGFVMMV